MSFKRKTLYLILPAFLLLASLLSSCQNGPTDQATTCNPKSLPVVKTLEPVQASSQTVYATSGPNLYAFNAGNGAPRWCSKISVSNELEEFESVTRSGGSVYTSTSGGNITVFNANSGALMWSTNTSVGQDNYRTPPLIMHKTVYEGFYTLYALNTPDGSVNWQFSPGDQLVIFAPPVITDGNIYVDTHAYQAQADQVHALDASTGASRWTMQIPKNINPQYLMAADGVVIFAGRDTTNGFGWLHAVDAQNGVLLWQKTLELGVYSPPIEANGILFANGNAFPGGTAVYAIDMHTGNILWSFPPNMLGDEQLLISNTIIYSTDTSLQVSAHDIQTGKLLWSAQLQASSDFYLGRLALLNNELFVGAEKLGEHHPSFFLHAFNITTHKEDWYANITGVETSSASMVNVAG